jgi:hypothetical protein
LLNSDRKSLIAVCASLEDLFGGSGGVEAWCRRKFWSDDSCTMFSPHRLDIDSRLHAVADGGRSASWSLAFGREYLGTEVASPAKDGTDGKPENTRLFSPSCWAAAPDNDDNNDSGGTCPQMASHGSPRTSAESADCHRGPKENFLLAFANVISVWRRRFDGGKKALPSLDAPPPRSADGRLRRKSE